MIIFEILDDNFVRFWMHGWWCTVNRFAFYRFVKEQLLIGTSERSDWALQEAPITHASMYSTSCFLIAILCHLEIAIDFFASCTGRITTCASIISIHIWFSEEPSCRSTGEVFFILTSCIRLGARHHLGHHTSPWQAQNELTAGAWPHAARAKRQER